MFKVNGKELNKTLGQIKKVVGVVELVYIRSDKKKKKVIVSAQNDQTSVSKRIDGTVESDEEFGTNLEVLSNACANRGEIELSESSDNQITFKSGKYKGKLSSVPYNEIGVVPKNIEKETNTNNNVDSSLKQAMFDLLHKVSLVHVFDKSKVLTAMVRGHENYMYIATADHFHAAIAAYENTDKVKLNFDFPVNYIEIINQVVSDTEKVKLGVDDNCIYVWSNDVKLRLPQITVPDFDFHSIRSLLDNYTDPSTRIEMSIKDFRQVLNNVTSVYENGSSVKLKASKKNGLQVSCHTNYGKVQDNVNVPVRKTDGKEINIESRNLSDVVSKIDDKASLLLFGQDIAAFQQEYKESKIMYYILAME